MIPNVTFTADQLTDFRIYMSVLPALPFIFMAMVWFPSIENAKPATVINILRQVVLYIPTLIFIPMIYGVRSIYVISAFIEWIVFIGVIYTVR